MDAVAPVVVSDDTFPKLLVRNAETRGDRPAMRQKDLGVWQTWTWSEVLDEVRAFAVGLSGLGISRGEKVAIIGQNRPRLYWAIAAVQSLGAVPVPLYSDSVADEMAYVLDHAEVVAAIVEDQEQVDKLLQIAERVPRLQMIVYDETRGMRGYDATHLHSFEAVQEAGRKALADDPGIEAEWRDGLAAAKGEDLAIILYTSGTTGRPKGVMLSYDNLVISARNGNAFDHLDENEETIAYLPMAWVGDHIFSYAQSYTSGYCVDCPESPETVIQDRREIGPTYFFAPPRVFEALLTLIMVRMEDAGRLKRAMFRFFMRVAAALRREDPERRARAAWRPPALRARPVPGLRAHHQPPRLLAPQGRLHGRRGDRAGDLPLLPLARHQPEAALRADRGERLHHHAAGRRDRRADRRQAGAGGGDQDRRERRGALPLARRLPGLLQQEEATRATKDAQGWVQTGDAGFFDKHGHLRIIDRAKDVGRLTNGALFAPKYIENKLKFFPDIKEAVAFGDEREIVCALRQHRHGSVGSWAERNNVSYACYQELAAHPDVYRIVREHIDQVNRDLAQEPEMSACQIRRFLILHKELDADDGELTRTQKVRRGSIAERYGAADRRALRRLADEVFARPRSPSRTAARAPSPPPCGSRHGRPRKRRHAARGGGRMRRCRPPVADPAMGYRSGERARYPAGSRQHLAVLRRRARDPRRLLRHPQGRDPRHHRAERRRQDVDAQRHQRLLSSAGGHDHLQGQVRAHRMRPHEAASQGIARTFQNVALFKGMTTLDNIMSGPHAEDAAQLLLADALTRARRRSEEIAHRTQGRERSSTSSRSRQIRKTPVGRLPYGLQKRVELGRALAMEPDLLLLDEPMAGMNLEEKEDMSRFILDVNQQLGTTIALIEHDMGVVMDLSDRVVVLDHGGRSPTGARPRCRPTRTSSTPISA